MANRLGMDSSRLANYEFAKARLPYSVVKILARSLYVSPEWLATGKLPVFMKHKGWFSVMDFPRDITIRPKAPFLQVWRDYGARLEIRSGHWDFEWDETKSGMPPDEFGDRTLDEFARKVLTGFPSEGIFSSRMIPIPVSVKELIAKLNRFCQLQSQVAVASALGVSPQKLNDWLRGRREPGGNAVLRLLQWVQAEETKQTTSPSSEPTPPGQQTRTKGK